MGVTSLGTLRERNDDSQYHRALRGKSLKTMVLAAKRLPGNPFPRRTPDGKT
jgi:hypothetical protein